MFGTSHIRFGRIAVLVTCWFTLVLAQFVAALPGTAVALGGAVVVGLLSPLLLRLFRVDFRAAGTILLPTGASLVGVAPGLLNGSGGRIGVVLSPILALATSTIVVLAQRGTRGRCALCNRRLGSDVWFRCPRCGLRVCDQECWDFDNIRCRLCQQNKVPMPTFADSHWLNDHFGEPLTKGRCQLCLALSSEADLRACPNCGRPQCRACWDVSNGRCNHCRWLVDDLPAQLTAYLEP
jgi:hypothetical protein